ncbi:MAG: DUF2889 domain-containing protein [Pseudomonadota bacterium]
MPAGAGACAALLGGVAGCTHLVDLLGPIGTIAFQTIKSARAKGWPSATSPRIAAGRAPAR